MGEDANDGTKDPRNQIVRTRGIEQGSQIEDFKTRNDYMITIERPIPTMQDIERKYKNSVFLKSALYFDLLQFINYHENNYPIRSKNEILDRYLVSNTWGPKGKEGWEP